MATNEPRGPDTPCVTPVFPLLLLETMRDMDRPEEYLEGEDVALSMPRRLGLSDVIYTQIHRFKEEMKRKRPQTPAVVMDLVRLVIRRPDADEIFDEAGRRVAKHFWLQRSGAFRRMVRFLPPGLAQRSARKAADRLFRQLAGDAVFSVTRKPIGLRMTGTLTARADPGGAACAFYNGALSELMTEYTGRRHSAKHSACEARGGAACEWVTFVVA
jgi:bacteriochlorophyll 4-vinyl reductase